MSLLRKVPGFRSGKLWKKVVASVVYGFIGLHLLVNLGDSQVGTMAEPQAEVVSMADESTAPESRGASEPGGTPEGAATVPPALASVVAEAQAEGRCYEKCLDYRKAAQELTLPINAVRGAVDRGDEQAIRQWSSELERVAGPIMAAIEYDTTYNANVLHSVVNNSRLAVKQRDAGTLRREWERLHREIR